MVKQGRMPPSAHDFPIRDMLFSNGEKFALTRCQPGTETSRHLFFPGCQLSASAPEHVRKTYAFLCQKLQGGVGLMLRCCGAPADWSGRVDFFGLFLGHQCALGADGQATDDPGLLNLLRDIQDAFTRSRHCLPLGSARHAGPAPGIVRTECDRCPGACHSRCMQHQA